MYKISGIYKIQSKLKPEKFYIGSAKNIRSRWLLHLADLKKNQHHSPRLQNHYNKYGKSDFDFIIIELCFPDFLVSREQYYIDNLKPFFNINKIANSSLGIKRSPETCERIRKAKLGKPSPLKGKKRGKMSDEFRKKRSEYMKGNKLNKGKHWKWTEEQKDKWLNGDKNPSHKKKLRKNLLETIISN